MQKFDQQPKTDDDLVIGQGGFGETYKGFHCIAETSHSMAAKQLDLMSSQGAPEFRVEIEMLSKLHCHLVYLIGFCEGEMEMQLHIHIKVINLILLWF